MHIVMVGYMDLTGPGVIHLYHFANELERRGHKVLVLLDGDTDTIELMEEPPLCQVAQAKFNPQGLEPAFVRKIKDFDPDLVHIWTPRNVTGRVGLAIKYHTDAKLIIHYEDDEDFLQDFHQADALGNLDYFVQTLEDPHCFIWQHPVVSFLANHFADAFTAICPPYIPRLERQWGKKAFLLYPGVDLARFHPDTDAAQLRRKLDLEGQEVIVYSGSISAFHQFDLVLQAFALVADRRPRAKLIHAGPIYIEEEVKTQVRRLGLADRVHFMGAIPHKDIHRYLALGDALVQCGEPNTFNEFRLPAKLPEYLAMGKPVITFSAGIGRQLADGKEVLKTYTGTSDELATRIEQVLQDPKLQKRLGAGARRKAETLFNWQDNTTNLVNVYKTVLDNRANSTVEPRIRPSIASQAFGSWWHTRDHRHILVVAGETNGRLSDNIQRTEAISRVLESYGHIVTIALPSQHSGPEIPATSTERWAPDGLNLLVWQIDPEILLFTHWTALRTLDSLIRRPVVLDLTSGWSTSPGGTGTLLQELAKVDFFICQEDADRSSFLEWATRHGLQIESEEVATIRIEESSVSTSTPVQQNAGRRNTKNNILLKDGVMPLVDFCNTPFVRRSLSSMHPNGKSLGMLIDEAIRHYRRGGMSTLAKETWGFLRRRGTK